MIEMYNLASIIASTRDSSGSPDIQGQIETLNEDLSKNFKDTFMLKRTHDNPGEDESGLSKRPRESKGGQRDNADNGLSCGEDVFVFEDSTVVDTLTGDGIVLESDGEDEYGLTPLNQVK
jgi:hypothetical protein